MLCGAAYSDVGWLQDSENEMQLQKCKISCVDIFLWGFRPRRAGEARSPEGTREISRNQGSELSNATIVPQGDVVADITRRADKLILIPGNAQNLIRR
jgi:hypothetical protein